jgi:hypothetical protein
MHLFFVLYSTMSNHCLSEKRGRHVTYILGGMKSPKVIWSTVGCFRTYGDKVMYCINTRQYSAVWKVIQRQDEVYKPYCLRLKNAHRLRKSMLKCHAKRIISTPSLDLLIFGHNPPHVEAKRTGHGNSRDPCRSRDRSL